ncbi:MAG: site-specific integrase, partial [Rhodospirillales bacterium]|nr:site-specific integrase [Rhodospirillales bacterium]
MARPGLNLPPVPPPLAEPDASDAFAAWRAWLAVERRVSPHTLAAYARDLAAFFAFLAGHLGKPAGLGDLAALRTADFRAWLAIRHRQKLSVVSSARALSVVRGFFRWLDRRRLAHNPNLAALRTPKQPKSVPKPLAVADAEATVEGIGDFAAAPWLAARDVAVLTLLYGAGLRIDEALSLDRRVLPLGETLEVLSANAPFLLDLIDLNGMNEVAARLIVLHDSRRT